MTMSSMEQELAWVIGESHVNTLTKALLKASEQRCSDIGLVPSLNSLINSCGEGLTVSLNLRGSSKA